MTQSQLDYFLVVASEMSISRASEILFVSQPAVSRQLAQLEEELGVKLFNRVNHRLEITDAGRDFESLFSTFNRNFEELKKRHQPRNKQMEHSIGFLEGWNVASFYSSLQNYLKDEFDNLTLHISGHNMDRILFALRNGKIDSAIVFEHLFDDYKDIVTHKIGKTESVLLYSQNHPLSCKENVCLSDFRGEKFCVSAPVGFKNAYLNQTVICQKAGFHPDYKFVQTLSEALMLVQTGEYVMIADRLLMAKENPLYNILPLEGSERHICLAYLKDKDSVVCDKIHADMLSFFEENQAAVA